MDNKDRILDREQRYAVARGGIGTLLFPLQCPVCGYFSDINEEDDYRLMKKGEPCPNCKQSEYIARAELVNYINLANWIGEYSISKKKRDHASAVIMFCALVESLLQKLNEDYLEIHPERKANIKNLDRLYFEEVFGQELAVLIDYSPLEFFHEDWAKMRKLRNDFMHGKLTSNIIVRGQNYSPPWVKSFPHLLRELSDNISTAFLVVKRLSFRGHLAS